MPIGTEYDVAARCKDSLSLVACRRSFAVCASHRVLPNKQEFIACLAKSTLPHVEFLLLYVRKRLISLCERRYRSSFLCHRRESTFRLCKQSALTELLSHILILRLKPKIRRCRLTTNPKLKFEGFRDSFFF